MSFFRLKNRWLLKYVVLYASILQYLKLTIGSPLSIGSDCKFLGQKNTFYKYFFIRLKLTFNVVQETCYSILRIFKIIMITVFLHWDFISLNVSKSFDIYRSFFESSSFTFLIIFKKSWSFSYFVLCINSSQRKCFLEIKVFSISSNSFKKK